MAEMRKVIGDKVKTLYRHVERLSQFFFKIMIYKLVKVMNS